MKRESLRSLVFFFVVLSGDCFPAGSEVDGDVEEIFGNFLDPWEYRVGVGGEVLLEEKLRKHVLPPKAEDKPKSTPEKPKPIQRTPKKKWGIVSSIIPCPLCQIGASLIQKSLQRGETFDDVRNNFVDLCVAFRVQPKQVCEGIFDVFGPSVVTALNMTSLKPSEICLLIIGEGCGELETPEGFDWSLELPEKKEKRQLAEKNTLPDGEKPTFKVLHLSDTHFDPYYQEGSVSVCDEPICCREWSVQNKKKEEIPAGSWGSYGSCDIPYKTLIHSLKSIADQHKDLDYIIWTGDLPPHDIWNQTRDSNLDVIENTTRAVLEAFPGIPVFPTLGNHESVPEGTFAPPWMKHENFTTDWLYEQCLLLWSDWLPFTSINDTLLQGGFYSVMLRPGFKLISLNMNYCQNINWFLLLNNTDPAKELKWLVHQLQESEEKGEKVHIIGHIPPGQSDCMKIWSRNYYQIIERFENTVTAQFFAHTHRDEFEVFYDTKEYKKPTNVAFIGPSLTTFQNNNPGYRIYYIDGDHQGTTREVIDYETWATSLEQSNKENREPAWYKLYSARKDYGLKNLQPKEWDGLIERMMFDQEMFQKFYRNYYRDSPKRPECNDAKCILEILCDLKCGKSHERRKICKELDLYF